MESPQIPTSALPTPLALAVQRVNVLSGSESAERFLAASYAAECAIKLLTLALHSELASREPASAFRFAHSIVRADGLGAWEQAIRSMVQPQFSSSASSSLRPLLEWATSKKKSEQREGIQESFAAVSKLSQRLGGGSPNPASTRTALDVASALVVVRNKTRGHGALGLDFFREFTQPFVSGVKGWIESCPALTTATWLYAEPSGEGTRAVVLEGPSPRSSEAAIELIPAGMRSVFFVPEGGPAFALNSLLQSNAECNEFFIPNGSWQDPSASCEYMNYATGGLRRVSLTDLAVDPAPLSPSETEGKPELDVQGNVFANLPPTSRIYVERPKIEDDLRARLLDKNHSVITLYGTGGMGKTSLALHMAHELAQDPKPRYDHILWLSARDVDLGHFGPISVAPAISDLAGLARTIGRLLGTEGTIDRFAEVLQGEDTALSPTLFIVDNFESLKDQFGAQKFLDTHTNPPNKVLITSRERRFHSDYPILVGGLEVDEAYELIERIASFFGVGGLLVNSDLPAEFVRLTRGHAYLIRILVGEFAKDRTLKSPFQLLVRQEDVAASIFERSFDKLSDDSKAVFLVTAAWDAPSSQLALTVALAPLAVDVNRGIEDCLRLSLLMEETIAADQACYSVPELARLFAKKKTTGEPDRELYQEAAERVRRFGLVDAFRQGSGDIATQAATFFRWCQGRSGTKLVGQDWSEIDQGLRIVAQFWHETWLELATLQERQGQPSTDVSYSLRRAVEEMPTSGEAWSRRADHARLKNDVLLEISSLTGLLEADSDNVPTLRRVGNRLLELFDSKGDKVVRRNQLSQVRSHLERRAFRLDVDALMLLARLFIADNRLADAQKYADAAVKRDRERDDAKALYSRIESQRSLTKWRPF